MSAGEPPRSSPDGPAVHPSAHVEAGAAIGAGSRIWHEAQVRTGASLGTGCIVGKGAYVGAGVSIGRNCKIQNYACLYEGVMLEDGVFVGPAAVFTNDRFPRAVNPDGTLKSESDWEQGRTVVSEGAAIGAGAVVLPGLAIGAWSLIGAGSVVVRNVEPHSLVRGNPAQHQGWVCRCARPLRGDLTCELCGFRYEETANGLVESPIAPRRSED